MKTLYLCYFGLPLALVEAMFKGLPCVAGDIEVLREVITEGKDGLLVNPHEVGEIAAAMIKLFEQPELGRRLGEQALKKVETNFHAKITAVEWEDFYSYIINGKS